MAIVTVDNLIKLYTKELMLDRISFQVEKGDFCAVIGPKDSGKTPLLEVIANLKYADSGEIETPIRETRFVPDDVLAYENVTAKQLFEHTLRIHHLKDAREYQWLSQLFEINLEEEILQMTYMQNRCTAMIDALISKPQVLILDEPYTYLTEAVYEKLLRTLKRRCEHGMTVIASCDAFENVKGYANQYVFLNEGDLVKTGKLDENYRPWKMVTVYDCDLDLFVRAGAFPIIGKGRKKCFIYKGAALELAKLLEASGCSDFFVEELTLEEQLFYNFERWN